VQEQQLLRALNPNAPALQGRVSIPDAKSATLIQPAGRDWTHLHQVTMPWISAVAVLGMVLLLGVFYAMRGKIMVDKGMSGRTITRFRPLDRFAHWLAASTFIVLGVTGLNITFGKFVLLPVIGPDGFTAFSQFGKYLHNYLAWPFMLGLVLMFLLWVKDNVPGKLDVEWLKQGGGLFTKGVHPKADRFNAGQKGVFWMVIVGGAALSVSGVYMLFPYLAGGVGNLQLWTAIHGIVGGVLVAGMIAHIYIGSVGMQGAFDAMGTGEVDLNWAKEHHALWVQRELAKQNGSMGAKAVPAE
jgi:formate dehydrogenase subunit gamma